MESYIKMLHATKFVGATLLTIGIAIFLFGSFSSGMGAMTGVGIGFVMGAVFIFVIGMILVASEEMVIKCQRFKKESI